MAGSFLLLTADAGPAVQIAMMQELSRLLANDERDPFEVIKLLDQMIYAYDNTPNGQTPLSLARGYLDSPEVNAACALAPGQASNGRPGFEVGACSTDYYANLRPYDEQVEIAKMMAMTALGAAVLVALSVELTIVAVGYAGMMSPYVAARMSQIAPNLTARFDQMRVLGAVAWPRANLRPTFPNLRNHATRHGGGLGLNSTTSYYDDAVQHFTTGQRFNFYHDMQNKTAYITRLGSDSFKFTSTSLNGRTIFTHYEVNERYLNNIGITLPKGF